MPCYSPIQSWLSKHVNDSGKRSVTFQKSEALQPDDPLQIACGQCIGCRLKKSKTWAARCMHESQSHDQNSFITLTFNDQELFKRENPMSLDKQELRRFFKRLRKKVGKLRFYACGEYGEQTARPHYHALIFGYDFPDKVLYKIQNGHRLYTSDTLEKVWPYGHAIIGNLNYDSAAYVARYCLKKITGVNAEEHYQWINSNTGEILSRTPEFVTMSKKPGIGREWIEKYYQDVYPHDYLVINGGKSSVPKYYDHFLEDILPFMHEQIKERRKINGVDLMADNSPDRLRVKETIQKRRIEDLTRTVE